MLCQSCQKRPAAVHFTKVVNNDKVEMYLCDQCAKEKGQFNFGSPFNISDFFSGFIGFDNDSRYVEPPKQQLVCSKCGMSFEEFQKVGKMGCDNCYTIFGDKLLPLLKRLHGSTRHHGRAPERFVKGHENAAVKSKKVESMKSLLSEAIKNEEYEKAADIRDSIRKIESET